MLSWEGDECMRFIVAGTWEGVQRATVYLHAQCQRAVNVSNPRPHDSPSRPGEAPRKRSGFGQKSITYALSERELTGRVGARQSGAYMLMLELGTRHIDPRPWLLATAERVFPQLQALVMSGGRG